MARWFGIRPGGKRDPKLGPKNGPTFQEEVYSWDDSQYTPVESPLEKKNTAPLEKPKTLYRERHRKGIGRQADIGD